MTKTTRAKVEQIIPLTDSIIQLQLQPEPYYDYIAGQYLEIESENEYLAYSIANAPLGSKHYELHIRHSLGNPFEQPLFASIKAKGYVNVRLPKGNCHLNQLDAAKPIIFIAGGTGFAPVKAMIEQLLATGDQRPFELYWGARSQSDLYMDEKVRSWQSHVSHFTYNALLASPDQKETLVTHLLRHHPDDLATFQIIISGPFDMVYSCRDVLLTNGIQRQQLFSDAFDFEPPKE